MFAFNFKNLIAFSLSLFFLLIPISTQAQKIIEMGETTSDTFHFIGNVGVGTDTAGQQLTLTKSLSLPTTTASDIGVIYKGTQRFIHNFQHPTGGGAVPSGQNIFIGTEAGNFTMGETATAAWQASYNTGVGHRALYVNGTGYQNSALGSYVLYVNDTGFLNSALGYDALRANTTGYQNSALGASALSNNTTGYQNSALGSYAGIYLANGSTANQTSNTSVFLGALTRSGPSAGATNQVVIGYNAISLGSNTVVLGNDSIVTTALKGSVGIGTGTTTPAFKLEVVGTGSFSQPVVVGTPTDDSHAATKNYVDSAALGGGGGGGDSYWTLSGSSLYASSTDWSVGIGTTVTNAARLTLADHTTAAGGIRFRSASTAVNLYSRATNVLKTDASFEAGSYKIGTTNVIDASRNIIAGNGTLTSPSIRASSYTTTGLSWTTGPTLVFITSGSEKMRINNLGDVGIGTIAPTEKLTVNGNVQADAFYYSSDLRLKNNIQPLVDSINKIKLLNPVSFAWRESGELSQGFIAQDLEKVLPELVKTDSNTGFKSIQYGNLTAILTAGLQEQQKTIEYLETELEILKTRLEKLESK